MSCNKILVSRMMNSGLPSHYNNSFSSWFHEDTLRVRLKTFLISVTSHGWTLYPPKTINHVFKSNQSQPVNPCMKRNTFHGLFRILIGQGRGECCDCTPKASSEIMLVVGGIKKMFFECSLLIQVQFPPIFLPMFKFLLASLLRHP